LLQNIRRSASEKSGRLVVFPNMEKKKKKKGASGAVGAMGKRLGDSLQKRKEPVHRTPQKKKENSQSPEGKKRLGGQAKVLITTGSARKN